MDRRIKNSKVFLATDEKPTKNKSAKASSSEYSVVKMTGTVSPVSSSDKIAFWNTKFIFNKLQ